VKKIKVEKPQLGSKLKTSWQQGTGPQSSKVCNLATPEMSYVYNICKAAMVTVIATIGLICYATNQYIHLPNGLLLLNHRPFQQQSQFSHIKLNISSHLSENEVENNDNLK